MCRKKLALAAHRYAAARSKLGDARFQAEARLLEFKNVLLGQLIRDGKFRPRGGLKLWPPAPPPRAPSDEQSRADERAPFEAVASELEAAGFTVDEFMNDHLVCTHCDGDWQQRFAAIGLDEASMIADGVDPGVAALLAGEPSPYAQRPASPAAGVAARVAKVEADAAKAAVRADHDRADAAQAAIGVPR
jgi:hypothetical protein